ncbi:MAG: hypothetical protein ACREGL_08275 [Alphaproteobacteria bacterium]
MIEGLGGLVGRAIQALAARAGQIGETAENHPRTSAWLTLLGTAATVVGLEPGSLISIGGLLVRIGESMR